MASFRVKPIWAKAMHVLRPLGNVLPQSIYSHLWFRGPFTTSIKGRPLKINHGGDLIENELFWKRTFWSERATIEYFLALADQADTLLDVGANIGIYSLLAKTANPDLNVIAMEPSDPNLVELRKNIALNGFDITVLQSAATNAIGPVTFYDFMGTSSSASLEAGWREGSLARTIEGQTIDAIAEEYFPTATRVLIKIDVEGHEPQAIEGAVKLCCKAQAPAFVMEIIREHVFQKIAVQLDPHKYRYFVVDEDAMNYTDVTLAVRDGSTPRFGNYLLIPDGWSLPDQDPRITER